MTSSSCLSTKYSNVSLIIWNSSFLMWAHMTMMIIIIIIPERHQHSNISSCLSPCFMPFSVDDQLGWWRWCYLHFFSVFTQKFYLFKWPHLLFLSLFLPFFPENHKWWVPSVDKSTDWTNVTGAQLFFSISHTPNFPLYPFPSESWNTRENQSGGSDIEILLVSDVSFE